MNAVIQHATKASVLGLPLLVSFNRHISCNDMYNKLWEYVKPFVMLAHKESETDVDTNSFLEQVKSSLRIRLTDSLHENDRMLRTSDGQSTPIFPTSNDKVVDLMSFKDKDKVSLQDSKDSTWSDTLSYHNSCVCKQFMFLKIEYSDIIADTDDFDKNQQINAKYFLHITNHSSIAEYRNRVNRMFESSSVTLDQCFESFTQPELLDDDNMWYCSQCKEHVKAMKTVALWRLPNILVIHLKRFEYRNSFDRNKIGTLVDFPLDGFDMRRHTSDNSHHPRPDLVDEEAPNIYDLFATTNHYGRLGYGHYTAYARRFNEFGIENKWIEFDDENVSEVDRNGIVSPSAYVLFYRRRTLM
jgi:ubiquitin carboxyl-terminal hydrolase 4/11/15